MRVSEVIIDCSLYVMMPITLLFSGPVSPLYTPRAAARVRTHLLMCAGRRCSSPPGASGLPCVAPSAIAPAPRDWALLPLDVPIC